MMKRIVSLSLVAGSTLAIASSLAVYQDQARYTYIPQSTFIGLTKNIKATCEGESISLSHTLACSQKGHLCKLYGDAQSLQAEILANTNNISLLEGLIKLPQPNSIDASSWIDAAKILSKEQTRLALEKKRLTHESRKFKQAFSKQTKATMPLALEEPCNGELELTLPYGYITFSTEYKAALLEKEIKVTQELSILNRSGIDMKADEAHFYYRSAQQYVRPVHFAPWIVGERKEHLPPRVKRTMNKAMMDVEEMSVDAMAVAAPVPMKASYEDAREYAIKGLSLPSTGEPKHIPVMTWTVPVTCQKELFAYRNPAVFEVCSFTPKFQIEQNRWKVTKNGKIVNERAVGEYEKKRYRLYTRIDQDIKVIRKKIVQKERQTGIFGGTARKKDGFTLTIINKSDKEKKLAVTERIPTSTTEKIKVKLLSVHGTKAVDYHLLKDGKLKMDVLLAPNETQKIEVLFEISYDKDLKIDY
jgi:hypothetical protein